jgi:hypothetical protein
MCVCITNFVVGGIDQDLVNNLEEPGHEFDITMYHSLVL